jgi:LysM repeat protein
MEALKPWINYDHEGVVEPGQRFQAHGQRAVELELAGLAVPVLDEDDTIKVVADTPAPPEAKPRDVKKPVRRGTVGSRR